MLKNFQLAAIIKRNGKTTIMRIPLKQDLQHSLAQTWQDQLSAFEDGMRLIKFNAGYQPEEHECFTINKFDPPKWLAEESSDTVGDLDDINEDKNQYADIKSIVGFARDKTDREVVVFQNFTRSHVVAPGRYIFLQNGTYDSTNRPVLTLDNKLSAVLYPKDRKLIFRNYRTVNTFLSLADIYEEASEQQIREILVHPKLAPENVDSLATGSNQWFRKRFAMLRTSGVLDSFSAKQIQSRAKGYDIEIKTTHDKVVFPEETNAAKKLLQFLNEELFRGAITETIYETNSKREAD